MSRILTFASIDAWLEGRQKYIGSSRARGILGHGYAGENALSVYADMVSDEPRRVSSATLKSFRHGKIAERFILEMFENERECKVATYDVPSMHLHPTVPYAAASLDAWVDAIGEPEVVEAKFVGPEAAHEWREDVPPLKHQIQLHHQLWCTGWPRGHLVGFVGRDLVVFTIERNDRFYAWLHEQLEAFWTNHVVPRIPPEPDYSDASAEAIRRLFPVDSGEVVDLPRELVDLAEQLEAAKEACKEADQRKEELANRLKLALGEASYGVLPDGSCLSYKLQERKGYYVEPASFRVLRRLKKVPKEVALAIPAKKATTNKARPNVA